MVGKTLKLELFGESHGAAVGCVLTGLPAGETIDMDALNKFLARRRPGSSEFTTGRREEDKARLLTGVTQGVTNGFPLCALLPNSDTRSQDYAPFRDTPRPGHADYTALLRYGESVDLRGGGHFSGRLTAPLCAAGGIALQLLAKRGVTVGAHIRALGGVEDSPLPLEPSPALLLSLGERPFPTLSDEVAERMQREILTTRLERDSLGGVVECCAVGLPAGLGGVGMEGIESLLGAALFGIPAVKGVEFGAGFGLATMRGSAANDPFYYDDQGQVKTRTNNAGGLLGGITDGMPLVVRVAVKPTPSISRPQETVSLSRKESATLVVRGRHDPCIALRVVPVVEAVTALVLLDQVL